MNNYQPRAPHPRRTAAEPRRVTIHTTSYDMPPTPRELTQCRRTSMHQWPWSQVARWSGRAWSAVRSVTAYTVSVRHLLLFRLRILRVTWMAWAACGNRIPSSTVTTFRVRFSTRP